MSVFSLESRENNPVTTKDVDQICAGLGVTIQPEEKDAYTTLLKVFHESMESLMDMPGINTSFILPDTWIPTLINMTYNILLQIFILLSMLNDTSVEK